MDLDLTAMPAVPGMGPVTVALHGRGWGTWRLSEDDESIPAVRRLVRGRLGEAQVRAVLSRDGDRVAAYVEGAIIGHLTEQESEPYLPVLDLLTDAGRSGVCTVFLYAMTLDPDPAFFAVARTLDLDVPGRLFACNTVPADRHLLLPRGKAVVVTGTPEHRDALAAVIARGYSPGTALAYACLDVEQIVKPRSVAEVVGVSIDGARVGRLAAASSTSMMPLVAPLAARGIPVVCEAELTGNVLAVAVKLSMPATTELDEGVLARVGELLA